eukprot:Gb_07976 [translate_table: standard]
MEDDINNENVLDQIEREGGEEVHSQLAEICYHGVCLHNFHEGFSAMLDGTDLTQENEGAVASTLWGSPALLIDTWVSENLLWFASFMGLQKEIIEEIKSELGKDGCVIVVKELQRLDATVGSVYSILDNLSVDMPNGKEVKSAVE